MPTSLPTYTYVGCGRYIDVLCAAGTTQRNGQHQGTPYSSSHSRRHSSRHSSRYRSPCARGLRIERARAKEAAAGVGRRRCGRAPSLFSPPVCFTASLLHCFTTSLLATGYWLSLAAKVPQPATQDSPDSPGQPRTARDSPATFNMYDQQPQRPKSVEKRP